MTAPMPDPTPTSGEDTYKPFPTFDDLPKMKLADETEVKLKAGPWKKSRLGRRYNGKHNDSKEAIAEIKDLIGELIDKLERKVYANKDSTIGGHSGFGTESAAMMVWIRELRQEVNEL